MQKTHNLTQGKSQHVHVSPQLPRAWLCTALLWREHRDVQAEANSGSFLWSGLDQTSNVFVSAPDAWEALSYTHGFRVCKNNDAVSGAERI